MRGPARAAYDGLHRDNREAAMKTALVLAALLAVTPAHAGDTKESPAAKAPSRPRVATQKLAPPPWERTPGGQKALRPAPIARGSPR